jgi:hypothetical protein
MDKERLIKDKIKYEKEIEVAITNVHRLNGALAYINLLLKPEEKPKEE